MTTPSQIIALTFPLITAGILGVCTLVVKRLYGKKRDRAPEPFTTAAFQPVSVRIVPANMSFKVAHTTDPAAWAKVSAVLSKPSDIPAPYADTAAGPVSANVHIPAGHDSLQVRIERLKKLQSNLDDARDLADQIIADLDPERPEPSDPSAPLLTADTLAVTSPVTNPSSPPNRRRRSGS